MSRLSASADANNVSTQAMTSTYQGLIGVLGETDRSVETAGNMFALCGDNQAQLEQLTTSLTGAYSQFGDGLPIEGLAEAANETSKCGIVTGSFADAINWVNASSDQWSAALGGNKAAADAFNAAVSQGASKEDAFNAALAACSNEGERQQLVLSAMNALYGEAGEKYQEANKDLIAYNQSQDALGTSVASIGQKFMPAATLVQTLAANVLTALSNMIPPIDTTQMMTAFQTLAGFVSGTLAPAFQPVSDALSNLVNVVAPLLMPFVQQLGTLLQGVAPILATIATTVVNVATQIMSFVIPILTQIFAFINEHMPLIQTIVTNAMTVIQTVIQAALAVIQAIWNAVWPVIQSVVTTVWSAISTVIQTVLGVIQGIITAVTGAISGDWSAVWNGVKQVASSIWNGIKSLVSTAVNGVKGVISGALGIIQSIWSSAWNSVKSLFSSIWNGIKSAASAGIDAVVSTVTGIKDRIVGFFSGAGQWLVDSGRAILDGLASGISAGFDAVTGVVEDGLSFIRGLFPFSPAKRGPFSGHGYTTFSGKALMGDFADSIRSQAGKVAAATESVLGVAQRGLSAQLTTTQNVSVAQPRAEEPRTREVTMNFYGKTESPDEIARMMRLNERYGFAGSY